MADYYIAGLVVRATWYDRGRRHLAYRAHDCCVLPRSMRAFQMYEEEAEDIDIEIVVDELEPFRRPETFKTIGNQICFQENGEYVIGFLTDYENELPGCSIRMTQDYRHARLIPHRIECQTFDLQRAQYVFEGRLLLEGGFVLHGAAIEWNGRGIIFTGISGAGKSTQAHLWKQKERAIIINGDCPAIRKTEQGVMMYGTPWCGSSGEYMDRETKVDCIVLVKQSQENSLRQLHGNEKFMTVLSQVLRSNVDQAMLDCAIENVGKCMEDICVLELSCRKDKEAVDILKEAVIKLEH